MSELLEGVQGRSAWTAEEDSDSPKKLVLGSGSSSERSSSAMPVSGSSDTRLSYYSSTLSFEVESDGEVAEGGQASPVLGMVAEPTPLGLRQVGEVESGDLFSSLGLHAYDENIIIPKPGAGSDLSQVEDAQMQRW